MRFRTKMLVLLAAVALSSAPAHASTPPVSCLLDCSTLLPGYWESPTEPICGILLERGCGWY